MSKQRKLAAILFADIQGYSAQMEKDEAHASHQLAKFKKTLIEKVAEYQGKIVNFYGDGCLAVFDSPLLSVRCASAAQMVFIEEPSVPVRLGLHSGVVVYEDDNVYGDSVNQASRVESMGLAGSVLISESIRRHIKNQSEFQTQLVGTYRFKNIEEPMQVYALKNDPFRVPRASEISGKLKPPSLTVKYKWLVPLFMAVLTLAGLGLWQSAVRSSNLGRLTADTVAATPLSAELRSKRMAVMVFENQTMNSSLDAFGKMISDWITRGLMETGEANIISAANIQSQIMQAGIVQGANPGFAAATGVDVMLNGRYYLQEDRLIVHANIIEVASGEVIHALEPIEGPKDAMLNLLERLTQEVLGYWAVKQQKRFLQNPPKYAAYQKYVEGEKISYIDSDKGVALLQDAFREDTTFLAPLLKLVAHYSNQRSVSKADSLITFIKQKNWPLTKWESLRLAALSASASHDLLKAAELNEAMFEMDLSDETANYNAGSRYIQSNFPRKSLAVFDRLDPRYEDLEGKMSWSEARMALAYNRLGQYEKALQVAENYSAPDLYADMVREHIRSLVRLDSFEHLENELVHYLQSDIYNQIGGKLGCHHLYYVVCTELYLLDKHDLLTSYAKRYQDCVESSTNEINPRFMTMALFFLGAYEKALKLNIQQGIDKSASRLSTRHLGLLGICYVKTGQIAKAEEIIEQIMIADQSRQGLKHYAKAMVQAAMGHQEEAIASLKTSLDLHVNFRPGNYMEDATLKPLFDHPEFRELTRPRG